MTSPLAGCDELFAAIRAETAEHAIRSLLVELLVDYKFLSMQLGRGSVFWRGRPIESKPFDDAYELSYPPKEVARVGRLNDRGSPILYASTREETVLHELEANAGDLVQFLGFRVKEDKSIRLAAIGEMFHVYRTGYLKTLGRDPDNAISQILNSLGHERGRRIVYIDAFLANLLAGPAAKADGYIHTRVIGQIALERSHADGLFYPSVREGLGMNLAILPEVFDDAVFPVRAHVMRVGQHREFGVIEYDVLQEAANMDDAGRLAWRTPQATNVARFFGMTKRESEFLNTLPVMDGNAFLKLKKLYSRK